MAQIQLEIMLDLRHFKVMPKIIFSRGACTRQFSTTKPLISKEVKGFNNGYKSSIFVNSTINNLKFVNKKSILLLPFNLKYRSEFEISFLKVCSNLKRGKYTFEFYLYVKSDFFKNYSVYFRKNHEEFIQGFRLTDGYIKVSSVVHSPDINALCDLYCYKKSIKTSYLLY